MSERESSPPIETKSDVSPEIMELANEVEPQMREWYADFHAHPELGGEEHRTAEKIIGYLQSLGIEIVGEQIGGLKGAEGTGIVAIIKGKEGGPTIALRADMDALPVQERGDHECQSETPGVMHACGHDAHTSGLLGAAAIMKKLAERGKLPGNVVLMFQPSEEKAHQKESGATRMVDFLERKGMRKDIDAFFGLHVRSDMERGHINVRDGVQTASSGEVDITLTAPGGHIINTYDVPNLHLIFSEINLRLAEIFRPLAGKHEALVASARTKFEGSGYNVLPASAESTWVVRVASPLYKQISADIRAQIRTVVEESVKKYSPGEQAEKVGVKVTPRHGYRPIIHRSPELVSAAATAAEKVIPGCRRTENMEVAGEDFSFYLEKLRGKEIPGVFVMVGAANPEGGIPKVPHHSPDFKIDQAVLGDLAALHTAFSLQAMEQLAKQKKLSHEI